MAFLSGHRALDDQERWREQRARDAANLLSLTILLQGKKEAREERWKVLAGYISGADDTETAPADDWADFRAEEKRLFLTLDPLWRGAVPDVVTEDAEGDNAGPESTADN